jgi:hypothetical protein
MTMLVPTKARVVYAGAQTSRQTEEASLQNLLDFLEDKLNKGEDTKFYVRQLSWHPGGGKNIVEKMVCACLKAYQEAHTTVSQMIENGLPSSVLFTSTYGGRLPGGEELVSLQCNGYQVKLPKYSLRDKNILLPAYSEVSIR